MIDEKKLIELIKGMSDTCNLFRWRSPEKIKQGLVSIIAHEPKVNEWIPCSERLPEEHDSIFAKFKGTDKWSNAMFEKTSNEVNVTIEFEDGKRAVKTLHTIDGKWNEGNRGVKFKVIAWQHLPEEYKK